LKQFLSGVAEWLDSDRATYVIVGFGLILRIIPLVIVDGRFLYFENPSYYEMGLRLLRGEKFSPYWPPGVPYYLLIAHKIFGDGLFAARASILLIYVGFSFALYGLAKEVSSRRAGNLATLLFAWYPTYIRSAFNPSTEYPTAACLVAAVYLAIRVIRKPSLLLSTALGIALGSLALIRASSLLLAVLTPLYLYRRTKRCAPALTSLLVSLVLISAWLWKAYNMTGRFVMVNDANAYNLFQSNNAYTPLYNTCADNPVDWGVSSQFTEMARQIETQEPGVQQQLYRRIALHHIVSRPDLFCLRTFNRFRAYFGFPIHRGEPLTRYTSFTKMRRGLGLAVTLLDLCFYWPIVILAITFCFNLPSFSVKTHCLVTILGVAFAYAFPYWLTCSQPRYNFPVVPLFSVFAAMLLDSLVERSWKDILAPVIHSVWRRRVMVLALGFFLYIQVEWIWIVLSSKVSWAR